MLNAEDRITLAQREICACSWERPERTGNKKGRTADRDPRPLVDCRCLAARLLNSVRITTGLVHLPETDVLVRVSFLYMYVGCSQIIRGVLGSPVDQVTAA